MFDGPWESCMLVRGLNPSECASWVQAWGTIAAICAAIAVAWWQRHEERSRTAARERLAASAVAESIWVLPSQIQGCLAAVCRTLETDSLGRFTAFDKRTGDMLKLLPMPSEIDAQILGAVVPSDVARALRTAPRLLQQAVTAYDLMPTPDTFDFVHDPERIAAIRKLVDDSIDAFRTVEEGLSPLLSKATGRAAP